MKDEFSALKSENNYLTIVSQFATDLIAINTVDEILWHVARKVVAQLGFDDVVIYLLDQERGVLCQKAAFGNKNPEAYDILEPIEIRLGEGVVGTTAESMQSILIDDTRDYPGYIVDDEMRLSELSVPLVVGGKLIGVIDSEHPSKGFYSLQHQRILIAIASIAATKIVQAQTHVELLKAIGQLEQNARVQAVLFEISELIFEVSTIQDFYSRLHECISKLTTTKNLFISLVSNDGDSLKVSYYVDENDKIREEQLLPLSAVIPTITGFVLNGKKPRLLLKDEIEALVEAECFIVNGTIPSAWLGVPFGESGLRGIVVIQSYTEEHIFQERDKELLSYAAKHIRNAIERMNSQSELKFLALHDPLTNLPNRLLFVDRVEHAISLSLRNPESGIAVLFLDLDRFKQVNDSFGHDVGDKLLKAVSSIISGCVRETDTLCRLGGDEFAILVESVPDFDRVKEIAGNIIVAVQETIKIEKYLVNVSVSIGVTWFFEGSVDAQTLLVQADEAMYQAKLKGRNQVCVYNIDTQSSFTSTYKLESEFLEGIENQQFKLLFQPIIDLTTGRMAGAESLIRWHHPEQGHILPDIFLSELDRAGYMIQLDTYVITNSLRYLIEWQSIFPDHFRLNINVSSSGFLSETVVGLLREFNDVHPQLLNRLCIEITEQTIIDNVVKATENVEIVRNLGVQLALDDFGTGFSSLSYLHQFNFDKLKVDRSFISSMSASKGTIVLEAIIKLALSLDIKTVAEGVETAEQYLILKSMECSEAQGYYLSKPLSDVDIVELIIKNKNYMPTPM